MTRLDATALAGVRLERRGVEVRMSRESVKARLFGGEAQPTRLGRFVVLQRVGLGGMGVVYAAYDPELDRKVALKVLRNDVVRSRRAARQRQLLAEARAMARLSHPNVVTVFEVGTVDDQVFVAMEFVDAPTLRSWMVDTERSAREILAVFGQAGLGLAAAHAAGLVHRDFKPENVLVPDDGPPQVTDFGLAVPAQLEPVAAVEGGLVRPPNTDTSTLTRELAGTPTYMAPEQLARRAVDARADQYSLCATLYEALVGQRPYGDDVVLRMNAEPEFRPPPVTLPEGQDVSTRVARAIERGLAFDPAQRFPDIATLLRELSPPRRSGRSLVMFAVGAAAAAGLTGLFLGGERSCQRRTDRFEGVWDPRVRSAAQLAFERTELPLASDAWLRARDTLDNYVEGWLDMHQDACRATRSGEQSDELLDRRMRCLDGRIVALGAVTEVLADADEDVVKNAVRIATGLDPVTGCSDPQARELTGFGSPLPAVAEAEAAAGAAEALRRAGKFDEALQRAEQAVSRAEAAGYEPAIVRTSLVRGRVQLALAQGQQARASFERAIEHGGSTGQLDDVAAAAIGLVEVTGVADAEHDDGLVLARAAAIAVASAGGPARLEASLELSRARVLYGAGELDEGLVHARKGLAVLEAQGAPAQSELADALQLQGTLLYGKGRLSEAATFSERALELRQTVFGPTHPSVAQSLSNLGAIALVGRDVPRALDAFERALDLLGKALGPGHPDTAKALANLASARRVAGDLEGARDGYAQALQRLEAAVRPDDPRVGALLLNLGSAQYELGEVEPAVSAYRKALAIQRGALGPDHPELSVTLANLGRALLEDDQAADAAALFEEALAIRTKSLGPDHARTVAAKLALAAAHTALGRLDRAHALLTSATGTDEAQEAERALWLGRVALEQDDTRAAIRWLDTAIEIRTKIETPPDDRAAADLLLAVAHERAGHRTLAGESADRAANSIQGGRPPRELREFCASDCMAELARLRTYRGPQ